MSDKLNWTQECALAWLRERTSTGRLIHREACAYRPNTLDSLVRRGLAECTWSRDGGYATAYRITQAGMEHA